MAELSVGILTYNHPEISARCIQSALQHYSPQQIYILHNGSEKKHVECLKQNFPECHHLILEQNRGFAGGANFLIGSIDSNWVLFLTNDCKLMQQPELPTQPAFVAPLIWGRKAGHIDSIGGLFDIENSSLHHAKAKSDWCDFKNRIRYVPGTAFLLHKNIFESIGGFDESLFTYWEDVDFSVRAVKAGYTLIADSDFQVSHQIGKTCHKHRFYTTYLYQRNRKRISLKYASGRIRQGLIWGQLLKTWCFGFWRLLWRRNFSEMKHLTWLWE